jgi:hypothetical protein
LTARPTSMIFTEVRSPGCFIIRFSTCGERVGDRVEDGHAR